MTGLTVAGIVFTAAECAELVNNYHLARTALLPPPGGHPGALREPGRYDRMIWAARWFATRHPGIPEVRAYKAIDRLLA